MRSLHLFNILFLLVSSVALMACGPAATQNWQSRVTTCPTSAELGRFSPWDRLEIRVYGEPELSGEYEVSPKGTISFPRLGELNVEGLRCDELERTITDALKESYLRDPSVTCINKEVSKTAVTVDGQVKTPGIVDFRPGLMITDVIAQSGGLTTRALGNSVVITRKLDSGSTESLTVPYLDILSAKEPNICLHPADLIYVPMSAF